MKRKHSQIQNSALDVARGELIEGSDRKFYNVFVYYLLDIEEWVSQRYSINLPLLYLLPYYMLPPKITV